MKNVLLYAATVLVWGSSFIGIKYQLGVVPIELSLVYRFALAALILVVFCTLTGRNLRFGPRAHVLMALLGLFLFSVNQRLIYGGTQLLTSGLVSVVFSILILINVVNMAVFYGKPITLRVVIGGFAGIAGLGLVFWPEVQAFDLARDTGLGLLLTLCGTLVASIGMMISLRSQNEGLSVMATNAWAMAYGAFFMAMFAMVRGVPIIFDPSPGYVLSLFYITVFSSVIGFGCYLTLLGRIGADRASYAAVVFPIVALAISTVVEDFQWTMSALFGVLLVLLGNTLALTKSGTRRRLLGLPVRA